jgi:hypothetical protein
VTEEELIAEYKRLEAEGKNPRLYEPVTKDWLKAFKKAEYKTLTPEEEIEAEAFRKKTEAYLAACRKKYGRE